MIKKLSNNVFNRSQTCCKNEAELEVMEENTAPLLLFFITSD